MDNEGSVSVIDESLQQEFSQDGSKVSTEFIYLFNNKMPVFFTKSPINLYECYNLFLLECLKILIPHFVKFCFDFQAPSTALMLAGLSLRENEKAHSAQYLQDRDQCVTVSHWCFVCFFCNMLLKQLGGV